MLNTKKELPFSGCNLWLSPDLAQSKAEFKVLIEDNGGKVCTRLSGKVNFAVARRVSEELTEKLSKYTITIILDAFLHECVKANKPLLSHTQKENHHNHSNPLAPLPAPVSSKLLPSCTSIYDYSSSQRPSRRTSSIRERLQNLSLKNKNINAYSHSKAPTTPCPLSPTTRTTKPPAKTITKTITATSAQRVRLRNAASGACYDAQEPGRLDEGIVPDIRMGEPGSEEGEEKVEEAPSLHNLVFVVCGTFSMGRAALEALIVANGGRFVRSVSDEVTHLLFGGENYDCVEFVQAKERKINIVNEYFLRLLIKY